MVTLRKHATTGAHTRTHISTHTHACATAVYCSILAGWTPHGWRLIWGQFVRLALGWGTLNAAAVCGLHPYGVAVVVVTAVLGHAFKCAFNR